MATKVQMVDYIYNNFSKKGKKIPKKELNQYSYEYLKSFIKNNNCEENLVAWINRPKLIKYLVDGMQGDLMYLSECEFPNEEDCKAAFENEGIKVIKIATKSNHHRCKYCNQIAESKLSDLLCWECRTTFGHMFYSEL